MCCPKKAQNCIKIGFRYTYLLGIIAMLALFGFAIWFGADAFSNEVYKMAGAETAVGGVIITFAIIILLVMACGCVVFCCSNWKIAIFPYSCCGCLLITAFVLIGVAVIVLQMTLKEVFSAACGDSSWSFTGKLSDARDYIENMYDTADSFYCESVCPCAADWPSFPSSKVTSSTGVVNVLGCESYIEDYYNDSGANLVFGDYNNDNYAKFEKYAEYFAKIEKRYKCSGMCTAKEYYYFWDVNNGNEWGSGTDDDAPSDACVDSIKNKEL